MFHWLKLIVYFPICLFGYAKSNILFDAAKTRELKPNSSSYFLMKTSEICFERSNMSKSYCIENLWRRNLYFDGDSLFSFYI